MAEQDLDPRALEDLARSGLASTDMDVRNAPGASSFSPSAGYVFPYYTASGAPHPKMHRVRYYDPRLMKGRRYDQPTNKELGCPNPPYFAPPHVIDYSAHSPHKLVVEGEKKAVAAIKFLGLPAAGIGGCWNWVASGKGTEEGGFGESSEEAPREPTHEHHEITPDLLAWVKRPDTERVEFVFDSDVMTKRDVSRAASAAWWMFKAAGIDMRIVLLPPGAGGLDDWILALPDGSAPEAFAALPRVEGWQLPHQALPETFHALGIPYTKKFGLPVETNEKWLRCLLEKHPKFTGHLWVDLIKHRCMIDDEPFSDKLIFEWLCGLQEFFPKLSNAVCYQSMVSIAWMRSINPICEWLKGLKWDGVPRIEEFSEKYLCLYATPYLKRVFSNFMVAAVARMFVPGTKFDHMVVLQGPQGIGKTRALVALFGQDMTAIAPHTTAIGSRDWLDAAGTGWCLILDELAGLSRVEHTDLKTALSTDTDTYRRAYRRDPETFPRMFVLAATTNETAYLTDPTGNRRYWPVPVRRVNVDRLIADREQLWAEAYALYDKGFDFWHMPENAQREAEQRQEEAHSPDEVEEVCASVCARAFADSEEARPPKVVFGGQKFYFVGTMDLMHAVSGENHAFAKNTGLSKRIRSAMTRAQGWVVVFPYINEVKRRGYGFPVTDADAAPCTHYDTTWEDEFGRGSKF